MRTEYKTVKILFFNEVALLTIDNPPVNPMSPQLSQDLREPFPGSPG